ncbi:MAG: 30S ribosomal protein S14 [Proteobacteria bacterium]|nr:30S ribosomal protein S14 [Pseudomonadota bacterium]
MAKKSVIERNKRRIRIAKFDKNARDELKSAIKNKSLTIEERFKAQIKLSKMRKDGSSVRICGRCEITGRKRGYYRFFGLSRICLRSMASTGDLPGVKKASW